MRQAFLEMSLSAIEHKMVPWTRRYTAARKEGRVLVTVPETRMAAKAS